MCFCFLVDCLVFRAVWWLNPNSMCKAFGDDCFIIRVPSVFSCQDVCNVLSLFFLGTQRFIGVYRWFILQCCGHPMHRFGESPNYRVSDEKSIYLTQPSSTTCLVFFFTTKSNVYHTRWAPTSYIHWETGVISPPRSGVITHPTYHWLCLRP